MDAFFIFFLFLPVTSYTTDHIQFFADNPIYFVLVLIQRRFCGIETELEIL